MDTSSSNEYLSSSTESSIDEQNDSVFATAPRRYVAKTPQPEIYRSNETMEYVYRLLNGESIRIIPSHQRPNVINQLKIRRDEGLSRGHYKEAETCDALINELTKMQAKFQPSSQLQAKQDKADKRLSDARNDMVTSKKHYNELLEKVRAENSQARSQLEEKHYQECVDFFDKFQNPVKMRQATKASPGLQHMRTQAILYEQNQQYHELKATENAIALQEEHEANEAARSLQDEYDRGLKLLQQRQKSEADTLAMAHKSREETLEVSITNKLDAKQRRIEILELEANNTRDNEKMWALYFRNQRTGTRSVQKREKAKIVPKTIATLNLPPLKSRVLKRGPTK